MDESLKNKILKLRQQDKSYDFIAKKLGCSKGVISFHCNNNGVGGSSKRKPLTEKEIFELNEFYKTHSINECMNKFNLCRSSVVKYTENKHVLLTEEQKKIKNYDRVKNRRQENKLKAIKYKGGKCENCGYDKCVWALDFHHINKKDKDFSIAQYSTLSWEKIKLELDKCMILCANCHREKHYQEYINKQ